jgi:hypothetical protein
MTDESRKKPTKSASMSTISDKRTKKLTREALAKHLFLRRGRRKVRELFEGVLPPASTSRTSRSPISTYAGKPTSFTSVLSLPAALRTSLPTN